MSTESMNQLRGTYQATLTLGNDEFRVVVEIDEPLAESDLERTIEGLAGNELRARVKRPSEAIFLDSVEALPGDEKGEGRLDEALENPNWRPGVRVVSIRPA